VSGNGMATSNHHVTRPTVWLIGALEHADFRDAMDLLQADAQIVTEDNSPELIVLAQTRPGEISLSTVERLRRLAALAGLFGFFG
jgi:hypothetical protein